MKKKSQEYVWNVIGNAYFKINNRNILLLINYNI